MDDETIISEDQNVERYRLVEVGTRGTAVRLYVEDAGGLVEVLLEASEALDLMAALGQAVRAL